MTHKRYTHSDYLKVPGDERFELIDGVPHHMPRSNSPRHQAVLANVAILLMDKLEGKHCMTLMGPLDVVFSEYDVVQPDVIVVCDKNKISDDNIQGAPDLIVEVLSPETTLKDMREKKALYEQYGVREYVIVNGKLVLLQCNRGTIF